MIAVIAERCDGCEACVAACPTGAIVVENGLARVNSDLCRLCAACLDACPRDALVISESGLVGPPVAQVALPRPDAVDVVVHRSSWLTKAVPLATAVVSFVGREVLPLVIDRLTAPGAVVGTSRDVAGSGQKSEPPSPVVRRRHRHHGGRA